MVGFHRIEQISDINLTQVFPDFGERLQASACAPRRVDLRIASGEVSSIFPPLHSWGTAHFQCCGDECRSHWNIADLAVRTVRIRRSCSSSCARGTIAIVAHGFFLEPSGQLFPLERPEPGGTARAILDDVQVMHVGVF